MSSLPPMPKITILKRTRSDVPFAQKKFLKKTRKGKVMKGEVATYLLPLPPMKLISHCNSPEGTILEIGYSLRL
jgi:hypothetical protein